MPILPTSKISFSERLYEKLREVPRGRVTTYKFLAQALGTRAYRAVGQVLRRNPYAPEVPCHRVVASDGSMGGFHGETTGSEIERKKKLLAEEGVRVVDGRVQDFSDKVWQW